MYGGARIAPAAAFLCVLLGAQSPLPELDPNPTPGLGGGNAADPRSSPPPPPALLAAEKSRLTSPDPEVRRDACARLGRLGGGAIDAFEALTPLLGDPRREVLVAAAEAVADILSADDDERIARLEALARQDGSPTGRGALKALALMRLRRESVSALMSEMIEHEDFDLRMTALQGLMCTEPCAPRAVRALGATMADAAEPEELRIAAAEALRRFGKLGLDAAQDVVRALSDRRVGAAAARVVHDWGPYAAEWARQLDSVFDARVVDLVDFDRQYELARAIERVAAKSGVVDLLLKRMYVHADPVVRDEAVYRTGRDQGKRTSLAKELSRLLLGDPEPRVRARAAAALGLLGEVDVSTIDALLRALRDPAARFDAALSLGLRSPDIENTVGVFASDPAISIEERAAFLFAAARLDPATPRFRLRLADLLATDDVYARGAILVFFGVLREAPPEADADLARALVDPVYEIRETARWTLARTAPQGALGRARQSLELVANEDLVPYWFAAARRAAVTPNDWEMISALGDLRHRVRYGADRIRPPAPPPREFGFAPDDLRRAAVDGDARLRELCARRIKALGVHGDYMAPHVLRLLGDPSRRVRVQAAEAAAAIGDPRGQAVSALTALLADRSWTVRRAAADAIRTLRAFDVRTVDALAKTTNDPVVQVRDAAVAALVARLPADGASPAPSAARR